jgi:hypothetical protein
MSAPDAVYDIDALAFKLRVSPNAVADRPAALYCLASANKQVVLTRELGGIEPRSCTETSRECQL